jgi:hypothetical protein
MFKKLKGLFSGKNGQQEQKPIEALTKGQQQAAADKAKFDNTPKFVNDVWGYAR